MWEASDRICGKRLRALLPILIEATERHGHLDLAPEVRIGVRIPVTSTPCRLKKPFSIATAYGAP